MTTNNIKFNKLKNSKENARYQAKNKKIKHTEKQKSIHNSQIHIQGPIKKRISELCPKTE